MAPFSITTTLPYVNSEPHVGFAMEIVRADVVARYHRLLGDEVFFNTGTDEHGAKIWEKAQEKGEDVQTYVDGYAATFQGLKELLHLSVDNFIRTTDPHHVAAAQEFWRRCDTAGDIYKKEYRVKYCVGCELEKTESELDDAGRCPVHPNRDLEVREEENYFFRFSRHAEALREHIVAHPEFLLPESRRNEMIAFLGRGLEDFSISRLSSKMPWGIPVPTDPAHVMYVWFDALVNYISALGWPEDTDRFARFWPSIQYCGKDNTRQQSLMWQAMLHSAGLPFSKTIVVDGFINSGGQKMSKSLGNVIAPKDVIAHFAGVTPFPEDVLRFVLLHDIPSFDDGDLTMEGIETSYATHLQNGLGNLTNRIMKMATTHLPEGVSLAPETPFPEEYTKALASYDLKRALEVVMREVSALDQEIQSKEPFKMVKVDLEGGKAVIAGLVARLFALAGMLQIFLPRTSDAIATTIREHRMPAQALFGRLG